MDPPNEFPMIFPPSLLSPSPFLSPQNIQSVNLIQTHRRFQTQSKTLAPPIFFPSRSQRNEDEAGLIAWRRHFSCLRF
ncbi:hypothetical protein ACFX13_041782 [Malus domestica]